MCFINMRKFGSFKNPFATITSLCELLMQKIYSADMNERSNFNELYGSTTSICRPWRWIGLDLIFTMRNIYINFHLDPLTNFSSCSRSTKFKDILPWKYSQMITKTIPISMRIVIGCAVKRGIHFCI